MWTSYKRVLQTSPALDIFGPLFQGSFYRSDLHRYKRQDVSPTQTKKTENIETLESSVDHATNESSSGHVWAFVSRQLLDRSRLNGYKSPGMYRILLKLN
uniref:Uncharacterized protein n=1 Tax=Steinernema glaseri TaxID=37863 RepID=A0A1I8AU96_9BILA